MRKIPVALLITILAVSLAALPASAGKRKARKATATYDSPAIGSADATGVCSGSNGCVTFGIGPKETSIDMVVEDSTGLPVAVTVGQDQNPDDSFTDVVGRFCGSTEEPLAIEPGIPVTVWLWVLPSATTACPGAATTGTVTATLR